MKYKHVMIDLETLGHLNGARVPVVTEMGITFFHSKPEESSSVSTKVLLSVEKSLEAGLVCDDDTVEWWLTQGKGTLEEMIERPGLSPKDALESLWTLFGENAERNPCVWAKSPSFDCMILGSIGKKISKNMPWKFYQERDVRTAIELTGIPDKAFPGSHAYRVLPLASVSGSAHDSLFDAVRQADMVRSAFSVLGGAR